MLLRVLNDNFKTFIQNQGYLKLVGLSTGAVLICFIPVSYYLLVIKNWGAFGMGLAMFQYEFCCLIIMIYLYRARVPSKLKNTELSLIKGLGSYIIQAFKMALTDWHSYILCDALNVIIGTTGDISQMAAFSLYFTQNRVNFTFAYGINVVARTQINYAIGI